MSNMVYKIIFTGPVGANQTVAVTFAKLDVDVLKEGLGPELHGDVGSDEHGSQAPAENEEPRILPFLPGADAV